MDLPELEALYEASLTSRSEAESDACALEADSRPDTSDWPEPDAGPDYDKSDPFDVMPVTKPYKGIDFRKLMKQNAPQTNTPTGDLQMNTLSNAVATEFDSKWSRFQTAIFSWVIAAAKSSDAAAAVVKAVAGSGKTTTIVEAAKYIPSGAPAVFLAFNKKIADELRMRLPAGIDAMTLNSLGYRAVKSKFPRAQVDADKVRKIIKKLRPIESISEGREYEPKWYVSDIGGLVAKAKAHGLVPYESLNGELATMERWAELADFYGVISELPEDVLFEAAQKVLEANVRDTDTIDFDDQLYFTVIMNIAVSKYTWIIVDEAQDLSYINREMLKKFRAANGKVIAVGDDAQAIYGFRGADSSSLDKIVEEFGAEVLPLSISYRCPKLVVERAQQYVPTIESSPTAADGTVADLEKFSIADFLDTDMVVCRNTAPIIKAAYRLIRNRLPCRVMGRDIGAGLTSLVKRIAGRKFDSITIEDFELKLNDWMRREIEVLKRRDQDSKIESVQDKVSSLLEVIHGAECQTCAQIVAEINKLFEGNRGVTFCTVHRSKGLEARRVFILNPSLMPSKMAKKAWQIKQEINLLYVAITRSLDTLYFLEDAGLV